MTSQSHRQWYTLESGNIWETVLDRDNNRRLTGSDTAYLIAAVVMTFSVLKGHSPIAGFPTAIFHIFGMLCSPFASAELLVMLCTVVSGRI